MPIRGVKEALALADLQFLVRHRYVLIGLFDTVTSVFLEDLTLKPLGLEEKMVPDSIKTGSESRSPAGEYCASARLFRRSREYRCIGATSPAP